MREMPVRTQDEIEGLIDEYSLGAAIEALAMISYNKADHIRSAYQDGRTADVWERMAQKLSRLAYQADKDGL